MSESQIPSKPSCTDKNQSDNAGPSSTADTTTTTQSVVQVNSSSFTIILFCCTISCDLFEFDFVAGT